MDLQKHLSRKQRLSDFLGEDKLTKITDEIKSIMGQHNLQFTPSVASDFFTYILETNALEKIKPFNLP